MACYGRAVTPSTSDPGRSTKVAVLLVAGGGTRLRPLTDHRPKALLDVGAATILGRTIDALGSVGVERLVLATGFCEEAVREAVRDCPLEVVFCRNEAWETTQNAVSLTRCADAVGGASFFKLDGDVVFSAEVLARLARAAAPLAVALDRRDGLGDEEMKVLAEGARITRFGKGLDPARAAGETMGIERIDASLVGRLFEALREAERAGRTDLYYEDVYDRLLDEGVEAMAVDVSDLPWTEVDTPEDLARAREIVRTGTTRREAR